MEEKIHVCYCVNRKVLPPFCVSAFSVAASAANRRVVIWAFQDDFRPGDIAQLRETLAPFPRAEVRVRSIDLGRFAGWEGLHGEAITFAKPLLPALLREETNRIVYLDADTIVADGIADLYDRDLEGYPIGAVSYGSLADTQNRRFFASEGLDLRKKSFNAGVLLIDVEEWGRRGLTEQVVGVMRAKHKAYSGADQAAQNAIFHGDFLDLRIRHNKRASPDTKLREEQATDGIIHFVGIPKPWDAGGRWLNRNHWLYARHRREAGVAPCSAVERLQRGGWWRGAKGWIAGVRAAFS